MKFCGCRNVEQKIEPGNTGNRTFGEVLCFLRCIENSMAQFLQDYFCNLGTCYGISQSMVVILQVEADVSGYGIQTVVGQSGKNFAGAPTGTVKFVVRIVHSIVHGIRFADILHRTDCCERPVAAPSILGAILCHTTGEGIGVGRIVVGQSVYLRGPAAEVVWCRTVLARKSCLLSRSFLRLRSRHCIRSPGVCWLFQSLLRQNYPSRIHRFRKSTDYVRQMGGSGVDFYSRNIPVAGVCLPVNQPAF